MSPSQPNLPATSAAGAFLHRFTAQAPRSAFFYTWRLDGKATACYSLAEPDAVERATAWSTPPSDTYLSVALGDTGIDRYHRITNDAVKMIPAVFTDIDVAGPFHSKPNLPPTIDDAVGVLETFGLSPSAVVHSGYGLQAWWFISDPVWVQNDEQLSAVLSLTRRWVDAVAAAAGSLGFVVDPVGDGARLLRLPGTVNAKDPSNLRPAELVYVDGPEYSVDQLEAHIARWPTKAVGKRVAGPDESVTIGDLCLNPEAVPPADRWPTVIGDAKIAATYRFERDDLVDQSPSGFDLSMACLLVHRGFSDQEIVDVLIAMRRENGRPPKLRFDYYVNTLTRARASVGSAQDGADHEEGAENEHVAAIKAQGVVPYLADALEDTEFFAVDAGGGTCVFQDGRYVKAASMLRSFARTQLEEWDARRFWGREVPAKLDAYLGAVAPRLWDHPGFDFVNVRNGLVHLATGELRPHAAGHLSPIQLPVVFDPDATCPAWDRFISEAFPADATNVAYELFALTMVPNPSIQKAIMLVGEGGNGKSTFLRGLQAFLGPENYATVPLHRLESNRFAAASLLGKLANICADLSADDLEGSSTFKGITGGDALVGERKFEPQFDFTPYARLIFSTNAPPRTPDASEAFYQRWIVVPFDRSFRGTATEIPAAELDAKLSSPAELSGMLNRAVAAHQKVRASGVSEPLSLVEAREAFRAATDPISVWVNRHVLTSPDGYVAKKTLVEAYNAHAIERNQPTVTANAFGRALRIARPGLSGAQRQIGGRVTEVWVGIGLRAIMPIDLAQ